jgi:hypothetical protein
VQSFSCLRFSFSFAATDPDLDDVFNAAYSSCTSDVTPETSLRVVDRHEGSARHFSLIVDDAEHFTTSNPAAVVDRVVWEVNQRVIAAQSDRLMLHAACVEAGGRAVVLAGPSGTGKSTLAAALVSKGFGYITDEAVTFDPVRGLVRPYPKPISLRRDVWQLFPELPPIPSQARRFIANARHLSPVDLGGTVGKPSVPALVMMPNRCSTGRSRLRELSRAETAMKLAGDALSVQEISLPALRQLARMLEGCACYQLEYDSPEHAARLITAALEDHARLKAARL